MDELLLAYLAGAMDSDGYFSIKRSTYGQRVLKNSVNPSYHELAGLKQVTPDIPELLSRTFGGHVGRSKGAAENRRPLWLWVATDLRASNACEALLPYLRVKRKQAEVLLELRSTKQGKHKQAAYWFAREFPEWQQMEMIDGAEVSRLLGITHPASISQAVGNGSLLALPYRYDGRAGARPRFPRLLVERLVSLRSERDGRSTTNPPQLIAWRERLLLQVRELNKNGVHGTPTYFRTGPYAPKD